ncbi:hypothetical protein KH5H1_37240 [Corallococcus caeni]|nr:hypothetical protein KH5H1_37240 [Corallococcus sp. KH5-1]
MKIEQDRAYRPGLDRIEEAVISSHFMQELCRNPRLGLYDDELFSAKALTISAHILNDKLLPSLVRASEAFARDRANAAKRRALEHCVRFGLDDPGKLGPAELITEVMFDRQFRRGPRETCSRDVIRNKVTQRIAMGAPIDMVIPALPYKFSCPLKTRGQLPDLAEANFLLGLYEIVVSIEVLYREARPDLEGPLARFTVICDGSRFNALVNEPETVVELYRRALAGWIRRLGLDGHIELLDYRAVIQERLPQTARAAKEALRQRALHQYSEAMWAVFDPYDMATTLKAAARIDPDPEQGNHVGRFVSLLKSLVFIVNYRSLEHYRAASIERFRVLYRELTSHLFEPFVESLEKEQLRLAMLREVWSTAIAYIAEIKSDRELTHEPICVCLPDHLRWTIHAKPGQLGLLTPLALGKLVQAWAGAAVFKSTGTNRIRLCTVPVLALEGTGAIPVQTRDTNDAAGQPLFYIDPDITFASIEEFVADLPVRLVRRRAS